MDDINDSSEPGIYNTLDESISDPLTSHPRSVTPGPGPGPAQPPPVASTPAGLESRPSQVETTSIPASGKPASGEPASPTSEKQIPSSGQSGLPPPTGVVTTAAIPASSDLPASKASGHPTTPSSRQPGSGTSSGQAVAASGTPATPTSGLPSRAVGATPASRQQLNSAGLWGASPSGRQQEVTENGQPNLEPIIEIINKSSETEIQIISQDFQCAVCDGKFRSENEIHEHWANHGEAQTSIAMMRKIFQLERMVKDSLTENKRSLNSLTHQVNFLQSQLTRSHIAPPHSVNQLFPEPPAPVYEPPPPPAACPRLPAACPWPSAACPPPFLCRKD